MIDLNCIVAFDKQFGIGKNNSIPWNIQEDIKYFRDYTFNNVVIMGINTLLSIPTKFIPLPNRINICITNKKNTIIDDEKLKIIDKKNTEDLIYLSYDKCIELLNLLKDRNSFTKKVTVIGGTQIYNLFKNDITILSATFIDYNFNCDKFFFKIPHSFELINYEKKQYFDTILKKTINYTFLLYKKNKSIHELEKDYLCLSKEIININNSREDRTGTGTLSVFGRQMRFNIKNYIPILTTKRVPWKSCIEELLWFLRGDTDANILKNKNVHIWDGNSSKEFLKKQNLDHLEEGDCGANYSFQWRHFGAKYVSKNENYENQGIDQIKYIEDLLQNDPTSRRIFLSAWNPADLNKTVLPPCHVSAQFYVDNNLLSCHLYQRSCDMFLGVPWNILSYTILTYILALRNNLIPNELIISTGDTHIYKNHLDQMSEQLVREPLTYPKLILNDSIKNKNWNDITVDDFELIGYFPHPVIKGVMSV